VELAPADELFRAPSHEYTRSLLDAVPNPDPRLARRRVTA
jgi:ABC-type oligopeptide transport system ATPase subunit